MFLSLGLEPKANVGVLLRISAELQRWHFPTSVPGLPPLLPSSPTSSGDAEDKDWTSPDATLHKCLIAGKTLASVIKAVI